MNTNHIILLAALAVVAYIGWAVYKSRKQDAENETHYPPMCSRCYESDVALFDANCSEKPEIFLGSALGQYHCPDCGAMVVAGIPHGDLCKRCIDRAHPDFDVPVQNTEYLQTR